jgi:hypothetical protein
MSGRGFLRSDQDYYSNNSMSGSSYTGARVYPRPGVVTAKARMAKKEIFQRMTIDQIQHVAMYPGGSVGFNHDIQTSKIVAQMRDGPDKGGSLYLTQSLNGAGVEAMQMFPGDFPMQKLWIESRYRPCGTAVTDLTFEQDKLRSSGFTFAVSGYETMVANTIIRAGNRVRAHAPNPSNPGRQAYHENQSTTRYDWEVHEVSPTTTSQEATRILAEWALNPMRMRQALTSRNLPGNGTLENFCQAMMHAAAVQFALNVYVGIKEGWLAATVKGAAQAGVAIPINISAGFLNGAAVLGAPNADLSDFAANYATALAVQIGAVQGNMANAVLTPDGVGRDGKGLLQKLLTTVYQTGTGENAATFFGVNPTTRALGIEYVNPVTKEINTSTPAGRLLEQQQMLWSSVLRALGQYWEHEETFIFGRALSTAVPGEKVLINMQWN